MVGSATATSMIQAPSPVRDVEVTVRLDRLSGSTEAPLPDAAQWKTARETMSSSQPVTVEEPAGEAEDEESSTEDGDGDAPESEAPPLNIVQFYDPSPSGVGGRRASGKSSGGPAPTPDEEPEMHIARL